MTLLFFRTNLNRVLRLLVAPILWLLYFLVGYFPRKQTVAVFGSPNGEFSGNTKYAFQNKAFRFGTKKIWITHTLGQSIKFPQFLNTEIYYRWSLKGIYYTAIAGTHYVNCYPGDINVWLSRNANVVNLWHGIPLKKIERHIRNGPMAIYFNPIGWKQKALRLLAILTNFGAFKKSDFVYCHSQVWVDLIADAFGVHASRVVPEISPTLQNLIHQRIYNQTDARSSEKQILYLPTMRDAYPTGWIASGPLGNLDELDLFCEQHSIQLHIKLHPNEQYTRTEAKNLLFMPPDWDIYSQIRDYDLVITDYSSIAFELDYASVPYALYWFDLELYIEYNRELYFDIQTIFDGRKVYDVEGFKSLIAGDRQEYLNKINFDNLQNQITEAATKLGVYSRLTI